MCRAREHFYLSIFDHLSIFSKVIKKTSVLKHLLLDVKVEFCKTIYNINTFFFSGGPLSALTCCVNARLLSAIKKNIAVNLFSKLGWELGLYYASYDDFHPDILARMYT